MVGLEASYRLAGKAHDRRSGPKRLPASVLFARPGHRECCVAGQALADAALLAGNGTDGQACPRDIRARRPTERATRRTIGAGP
jgi:hypothetical protein